MANAVAAVTIPDERYGWVAGNKYFIVGKINVTVSPAVYVTGGIVMNFAVPNVKATRTPIFVDVNGTSGYQYQYIPGADATSGLLKILTGAAAQSALTELSAAAIPAAVSSDIITFQATFNGQL